MAILRKNSGKKGKGSVFHDSNQRQEAKHTPHAITARQIRQPQSFIQSFECSCGYFLSIEVTSDE